MAGDAPGQSVPKSVQRYFLGELHKLGVGILTHVALRQSGEESIDFIHMLSGRAVACGAIDTLVFAPGVVQNNNVKLKLADYPGAVRYAGDCLTPRSADKAIFEGMRIGAI